MKVYYQLESRSIELRTTKDYKYQICMIIALLKFNPENFKRIYEERLKVHKIYQFDFSICMPGLLKLKIAQLYSFGILMYPIINSQTILFLLFWVI